ncbi:MAG TPA: sigma-54 dependent transcriptional regulator [Vicinamibacterales bacterium]
MPSGHRVLIIDDEADAAEALRGLLEPRGYTVRTAASGAEARRTLEAWHPLLVLMDLVLPDVEGLELLQHFKDASPECQVLMITGFGSVPRAVEAMNAGAFSFIEKPIDTSLLFAQLDKAREKLALADENRRLRERLLEDQSLGANFIGRSEKMRQLFSLIAKVAPTDASVLIHGENGTGKELVATALHQQSRRSRGAFVTINCAALPAELIESELFGHRRGAFTGAVADRMGLMELADGGSLLLDEIGEMPAALQVKLLRVLQDREFRPVGGSRVVRSDFRLICATNANLDAALADRKLREDLYFRINTVTIAIPPLRERTDDIPLLVNHFILKYAERHGRQVDRCEPEALRLLQRYRWPGNVRELEHVIERAVIVASGSSIMPADLPVSVRDPEPGFETGEFFIPPHHTLEEIERLAIVQTLERTQGNKRAAASILGVYRPTLYSKLRKYRLLDRVPGEATDRGKKPGRN